MELDEKIDSLDTELDNLNTKVENDKEELFSLVATLRAEVYMSMQELQDTVQKIKDESVPINHASEETKYGVGTTTEYGHLKIWDGTYPFPQKDDSVACSGYYASLLNHNITTGLAENKKLIAEITPTVLFEQEPTTGENNYQATINTSLSWKDFETIQIFYYFIDAFAQIPRISSATVTNINVPGNSDEVALDITETQFRTIHSTWRFCDTNTLIVSQAWMDVAYMEESKEIVFCQVEYDVTKEHRECPIYVTKIIGIEKKQDND